MMTQQSLPSHWAARFFTLWTGQAFSLFGSMLVQFALVWWLTKTTGSATVLALATMVALLPQVFLGPFVGALVDRWNRRLVMMVTDSLIALTTVVLAALAALGAMRVGHVFLVMFLRSVGGVFHWAAMQASTSLMVPERHLARVAGLNQTLNGALQIVAPPVGALLWGVLPLYGILAIDVGTALLAVLPLGFISIPQPAVHRQAGGPSSLIRDVMEGMCSIWQWPGVRALLLMATAINFTINPGFALMPILITRHFGRGALELGWMESAWGIGVVVGGLVLSGWGGFRRRILTTLMGLVGMGVGVLVLGLVPPEGFVLALVGMFFAGVMNPITNGPVFAIIQARVRPEFQGRVFTAIGSIAGAMMPLGTAIAGPVADHLGVQVWFLVGGVVCGLMGVASFFVPTIVNMEDQMAASSASGDGFH
ncbi:MAG: MFS transporter [Anaerolineae bacterium]|jgi:DHA3 family macrolide efflux protein-like MFS transporter